MQCQAPFFSSAALASFPVSIPTVVALCFFGLGGAVQGGVHAWNVSKRPIHSRGVL